MIVQKQVWNAKTIYLIVDEYGSVQLELFKNEQSFGGTCWLWDLFVKPEYRQRGHAKRLLQCAENTAKAEGHKSVIMEWEEVETPQYILAWYLRLGYEPRVVRNGYCRLEKSWNNICTLKIKCLNLQSKPNNINMNSFYFDSTPIYNDVDNHMLYDAYDEVEDVDYEEVDDDNDEIFGE